MTYWNIIYQHISVSSIPSCNSSFASDIEALPLQNIIELWAFHISGASLLLRRLSARQIDNAVLHEEKSQVQEPLFPLSIQSCYQYTHDNQKKDAEESTEKIT